MGAGWLVEGVLSLEKIIRSYFGSVATIELQLNLEERNSEGNRVTLLVSGVRRV